LSVLGCLWSIARNRRQLTTDNRQQVILSPIADIPAETPPPRLRLLQFGQRYAFPIPDLLMAMLLAAAAVLDFLTPEQLARLPPALFSMREELGFALMVEGGFLMAQGTLVDIATRLRKRPPIWAVVLIAGAVFLFSEHTWAVLQMAWGRGSVVFVPLLFSLGERATVLWRMPGRPELERIAARALVANRIITGLVLLGLVTAEMIARVAFSGDYGPSGGNWAPLLAGAIYYAVAAYDDWRVRGARFAERPSVLFRYDAIGIKYLPPV
jgi:hypothetical protein